MLFREIEEKTRKLFKLSTEELYRRGVEALLEKELSHAEAKMYSFLRLYELQDSFERNIISKEDSLEETRSLADTFRIDLLKTQIKEIKVLLKKLRKNPS